MDKINLIGKYVELWVIHDNNKNHFCWEELLVLKTEDDSPFLFIEGFAFHDKKMEFVSYRLNLAASGKIKIIA